MLPFGIFLHPEMRVVPVSPISFRLKTQNTNDSPFHGVSGSDSSVVFLTPVLLPVWYRYA